VSAGADSVWEWTPYRVQVYLALGWAPELAGAPAKDLAADLAAQADALLGASWDLRVTDAPPALARRMLADLEAVAIEDLPQDSLDLDKVFLLVVQPQPTGYLVAARELDANARWFGTAVRITVSQPAGLRDGLFRAVGQAFAPLAEILSVDDVKKRTVLKLRAGAIGFRDKTYQPVGPGRIFVPIVRFDDHQGKPRQVALIPWTFCVVDSVQGAELQCALHTGLHSPMSVRRRGRMQQFALAVAPPQKPTRLVLRSRTDPQRVLVGYDLYEQLPDGKTMELVGRTDRQGVVTITPNGQGLRLLYVKHGGELLARLPLLPGLLAEADAAVPDDDLRLLAEGYLMGLRDDVIDAVAERAILIPRVRTLIQAGRLDEAQDLLRQLQTMDSADQFLRELSLKQKRLISDDPAVQRRLDAMFSDVEKLIHEKLDRQTIEQLQAELVQARAAAAREQTGQNGAGR
jgi:hypothetical protein